VLSAAREPSPSSRITGLFQRVFLSATTETRRVTMADDKSGDIKPEATYTLSCSSPSGSNTYSSNNPDRSQAKLECENAAASAGYNISTQCKAS
jgi:hypothetical protein